MRTMTVGDFKSHFSEALKTVEAGEKIAITFGKKREIKAFLMPKESKKTKRILGLLDGTEGYFMADDFNVTTEDEFPI
jgi:antitoxin (DNA-binding transcriptional repressor) of toxin-antitoxin stability system